MSPTNLVWIMTDNQAPWSLGCYGNEEILTPNIDRIAAEGMRFTNAFCVNSVCSPSRATFMTGLIPSQHGVHCFLGAEKPDAQMGPHAYCTIAEFRNVPRILSERGYTCGLSGKWHLGDSLHPQEGFTYWFTKTHGHTATFYNDELIWQGQVYREPRYTTDVITEHAIDFLRQQGDRPFFLFIGYNGPYGLGQSMLKEHRNQFTEYYRDKELKCFPREPVHPWLYNNREIINNPVSIHGYAAAVSGVDAGVGRVLDTLEELGHGEDTLVVFTADQGLCGGHHGMWGMGDHSRPIHTYEETIRIPLLFRHRGRIPAGSTCDLCTANYDFFPSLLEYLGISDERPGQPPLPGRSYAPVLEGGAVEDWDETVFHEFENTRLIRTPEWKYTRRYPSGPDQLFHLSEDPGERENLIDDPACAPIVEELRDRLDRFFDQYADPEYDLWRGGRSKAGRLIRDVG